MKISHEHVRGAFAGYVRAYDPADPKIALKIEHTYKVAELCEQIARSEGFDEGFVDLAWLAGMLHDVGRFEQIARYDTFSDAISVPHAKLSAQILFDERRINDYVSLCRGRIPSGPLRIAIETHSDWRLPEDLDERTRALCNVLRDADKVDIMRVNCECPVDVIYPFSEEELVNSTLTPEVIEAFDSRQTVLTSLKRLPADYALGHCAFGWELVYPESRRLAYEQGYLARLFEYDWQLPGTREVFVRAQGSMLDWLRGGK